MEEERFYVAIDLKSFYASVECVARGLDPLTTNLVVADESRTDKTICLAVSPSLKALGVPGRPRLFEAKQILEDRRKITGQTTEFIIAPPRMKLYMDYSSRIYSIYLRYVSAEDIHVYSIDEVFIDVTGYLNMYEMGPVFFGEMVARAVLEETGITATVGVGTNLYLAKVAMDIMAKHMPPNEVGLRIAFLDEMGYRRALWDHKPLTSFWRVGPGIARKLEANGMFTMGDVARMSLQANRFEPQSFRVGSRPNGHVITGEDFLYKLFGVDAELLIDHAWGIETCTMADIKAYKPSASSISVGQVLSWAYPKDKAIVILREMVDSLCLDLVEKGLMTNQVGVGVGYERLSGEGSAFDGTVVRDHYGRQVPKPAGATVRLDSFTDSPTLLMAAAEALFESCVDPELQVRRMNITFGAVRREEELRDTVEQLDLFSDPEEQAAKQERLERERRLQRALLHIKGRYGKNAILKGTSYQDCATGRERNGQVGGHKA